MPPKPSSQNQLLPAFKRHHPVRRRQHSRQAQRPRDHINLDPQCLHDNRIRAGIGKTGGKAFKQTALRRRQCRVRRVFPVNEERHLPAARQKKELPVKAHPVWRRARHVDDRLRAQVVGVCDRPGLLNVVCCHRPTADARTAVRNQFTREIAFMILLRIRRDDFKILVIT